MTLGALVAVGLPPAWLEALPNRLGLDNVGVWITDVRRGELACKKVDFEIPPQPHGRHVRQLRQLVADSNAPPDVRARADRVFVAIAEAEGEIHGLAPDRVHLHEVGAVDAILDVVGAIWGLAELGISEVFCGTVSLGDGTVESAHGSLPVPAPATLKLLEGHAVRPGPADAGELVTPTGAALVKELSRGAPPAYVPLRSGFGAGTRNPAGRPNALRVVVAEFAAGAMDGVEPLVELIADLDDMSGEYVAGAAEALREGGALDVVCAPTFMKKNRPGVRLSVLARLADADRLERAMFSETTTIGVRRVQVERRALPREIQTVRVLDHPVRVKVAVLPGGGRRAKAEFDDVRSVATATGRAPSEVASLACDLAERVF